MSTPLAATPAVGHLIRHWRQQRRRSQEDLALAAGLSTRHMSFVETGRSRPSPAAVLALAEELQLPLRERNRLLLAAGYAPRFTETALDAPPMQAVQQQLQRLLDAHQPYPGVVIDRHWNIMLANAAARALLSLLPAALAQPVLNVFRISLHPQGLAAFSANFDAWGRHVWRQLELLSAAAPDDGWGALRAEVAAYPNVMALATTAPTGPEPGLLVPIDLLLPQGRLSMFSTLTTFLTPRDITLAEVGVELFYPSDDTSAGLLRALAGAA
ncbi:MAG: helix-turn-helix domain-containing protein [Aquabacterium sp.]